MPELIAGAAHGGAVEEVGEARQSGRVPDDLVGLGEDHHTIPAEQFGLELLDAAGVPLEVVVGRVILAVQRAPVAIAHRLGATVGAEMVEDMHTLGREESPVVLHPDGKEHRLVAGHGEHRCAGRSIVGP